MFAIQLARRAGYKVIATASPSSFDLVKSFGAHSVVSYRDQDAALVEIKKITNGGVSAGLDCVGGQGNITFAVNAFGPKGGKLSTTLMGSKSKRKEVELSPLMVFTVFGKVCPASRVHVDSRRSHLYRSSADFQQCQKEGNGMNSSALLYQSLSRRMGLKVIRKLSRLVGWSLFQLVGRI